MEGLVLDHLLNRRSDDHDLDYFVTDFPWRNFLAFNFGVDNENNSTTAAVGRVEVVERGSSQTSRRKSIE